MDWQEIVISVLAVVLPIVIAYFKTKLKGKNKILDAVIQGLDASTHEKVEMTAKEATDYVKTVAANSGVETALGERVVAVRERNRANERSVGVNLGLDSKGRPNASLDLKIPF